MAENEEKCSHAVMILQRYMCTAETCPHGNQSREKSAYEGEDPLPFCLSKGLEESVSDPELVALAKREDN